MYISKGSASEFTTDPVYAMINDDGDDHDDENITYNGYDDI